MSGDAPSAIRRMRLDAVVADVVADEGPYGPRYTWFFTADGPTGPIKLRTWTSRHLTQHSRAAEYATAILGRRPLAITPLDLQELVGRPCTVEVVRNDKGFLVVETVLPPDDEIPF